MLRSQLQQSRSQRRPKTQQLLGWGELRTPQKWWLPHSPETGEDPGFSLPPTLQSPSWAHSMTDPRRKPRNMAAGSTACRGSARPGVSGPEVNEPWADTQNHLSWTQSCITATHKESDADRSRGFDTQAFYKGEKPLSLSPHHPQLACILLQSTFF